VARILALVPDLLFGSRLQGALAAAGHDARLVADPAAARSALATTHPPPEVLVLDLAQPDLDGPDLLRALREEGLLARTGTLGFYAHVDTAARQRAEDAGFDLVVPRSRMAREAPQLIARVAGGA
jgi:DNA-binding response OmpR family regulator